MLLTTISEQYPTDPIPRRHFQQASAIMCLSVIAGIGATLYAKDRGKNRLQFTGVLKNYYPYDLDPLEGIPIAEPQDILYDYFRNPLVHRFGVSKRSEVLVPIKIARSHNISEKDLIEIERSNVRPHPSLVVNANEIELWVESLYWGIRHTIVRLTNSEEQCNIAIKWIKEGKYK